MAYKDIITLRKSYLERKQVIQNRLKDFKNIWKENDNRIFSELCFCLLTPQSKAKLCDKAIQNLVKTNILFNGNQEQIKSYLTSVRFHNNKSKYIIEARSLFTEQNKLVIKRRLSELKNQSEIREWLVKNIKGMSWKEASHFLRNIGFYENITILDRHILKNLHKYKAIKEVPKTLTMKKYFEIENKMKEFAKQINIPIEEIDLLFWSEETGEVFK